MEAWTAMRRGRDGREVSRSQASRSQPLSRGGGLRLAVYLPAKYSRGETPTGSLWGTFSTIAGQRCIIVDDVITTGMTLSETIAFLRRHGATPVAVWSLFDKRGIREVEGVPVHSLFVISRLG